jgi:orotidine-5'-phosphate decarboxylase
VTRELAPLIDGIKVGVPLLLRGGAAFIRQIKRASNRPIIADLKVADIGFPGAGRSGPPMWSGTNAQIIESTVRAGADYVTCHTLVGTASIEECVEVAHALGGRVLTLPYMTHDGASLFFDQPIDVDATLQNLERLGIHAAARRLSTLRARKVKERGWRLRFPTISDLIFLLGETYGVDGYIGPANVPTALQDYRKLTTKDVFATGIGRQGGRLADVYRLLGPHSAGIVGHLILEAPDPLAAVQRLHIERNTVTRHRRNAPHALRRTNR